MRQIKFRGYNHKNKQWLYGFYLQNRGAHFVCPDEFATDKSWEDNEVDQNTLGQYTGLKDKNGKEIYEGDIAVFDESDKRYIIEWHYDIGIIGRQVGTDNLISIYTWLGATTAIGNIYDNPELLKKTD